jgi:thiol-disulfide isomerase/thioredoxin
VEPLTAILVAGAVVVLAALLGVVWRVTTGRARRTDGTTRFGPDDLPGLELARGATLVQFSTEYCATCPATRRQLSHLASERDGVTHLDIDLTHRPELAKRLRILQTPTVFVLDATGRLVTRFGGAPRRADLVAAIDPLVPLPEWNL